MPVGVDRIGDCGCGLGFGGQEQGDVSRVAVGGVGSIVDAGAHSGEGNTVLRVGCVGWHTAILKLPMRVVRNSPMCGLGVRVVISMRWV